MACVNILLELIKVKKYRCEYWNFFSILTRMLIQITIRNIYIQKSRLHSPFVVIVSSAKLYGRTHTHTHTYSHDFYKQLSVNLIYNMYAMGHVCRLHFFHSFFLKHKNYHIKKASLKPQFGFKSKIINESTTCEICVHMDVRLQSSYRIFEEKTIKYVNTMGSNS